MVNLNHSQMFFVILILLLRECIGSKYANTSSYDPPPAVFVFGDSLSDTGNAIEALPFYADAENYPYGSTFFNAPSGRYSDGRLIIDFMASKWGYRFIEPNLKNIVPNYRNGINFAVSGATAGNITEFVPFFLPLQTDQFIRFKRNVYASLNSTNKSDCIVSHLPPIEAFEDGIYMIFIGVNDILSSLFRHNLTLSDVKENTVPLVVSAISKAVQDLHREGAKNFMIFNIPAIGCTPLVLSTASQGPFNSTDRLGCLCEYNEVVNFANNELEKSLRFLKDEQLKDISIVVVDIYNFYLDAIANPTNYGFKESEKFKACCGYGGGPFNYSPLNTCGRNREAKACSKPREYLSWDGLHLTDAFSQHFVEDMMKGMHYLKPILG